MPVQRRIESSGLRRIVDKEGATALVLFYGDWCGDCRQFKPTWDRWCSTRDGPIYILEVMREGREWREWSVDEVPTVAAFRSGVEEGRAHGVIAEEDLDRLWRLIR